MQGISITATTRKANEPTARNAAAQNVSTARIVTPLGRFTALTFSHVLRVVQSKVTPLLRLPGKRCDRSALSSKETHCLVVLVKKRSGTKYFGVVQLHDYLDLGRHLGESFAGGQRAYQFPSIFSVAAYFRSTCGSERAPPECSTQRVPTATPPVGQGTEETCFDVSSRFFIATECDIPPHENVQFCRRSARR